jgi:hypothetical protein
MTLGQFLLLYLLAGVAVAAAVYLTLAARGPTDRFSQVGTALIFWPLYLTLLLSRAGHAVDRQPGHQGLASAEALELTITAIQAELEASLRGLGGSDGILTQHRQHLDALRAAWSAQAKRVREMDRLLAEVDEIEAPLQDGASARVQASREAVRQSVQQLRQTRDRLHADVVEALALVRELISMLHLARLSEGPEARADELIAEIVRVVAGTESADRRPHAPRDAYGSQPRAPQ